MANAIGAAVRTLAAEMNITPLVDVMLVLLVIFMLAVPLTTRRIELDASSCQANCPPPQPPVNVSIKQTGEVYWNGGAINRATLAANLAALAHQANPPPLMVKPERSTRYALVTDVLSAASNAQLHAIGLERPFAASPQTDSRRK